MSRFKRLSLTLMALGTPVPPRVIPTPHRLANMLASISLVLATGLAIPPNPVYEAGPLLQFVNQSEHGKLYHIKKDNISVNVLHVWGTPQQLGYAQGVLLGKTIYDFMTVELDKFYESIINDIPMNDLPEWLKEKIEKADMEVPSVVHEALGYVYDRELLHLLESESRPVEEANAMALGVCDSGAVPDCNATTVATYIKHSNMLPELIRMHCSMMGAWGKATPTGKLTQLRSLDFGTGPFAKFSTLTVYHPDRGNKWMNIGFPGFVGAVTGVAEHLSLSEKFWHGQEGRYDGLPITGIIRDILQFADTKEDAHNYALAHRRTWSVFLGLGDDSSQEFRTVAYREADCKMYNYNNITEITSFAPVEDVVFLDKYYQPSSSKTMPGLVNSYYGNLTAMNVVQNFPRLEKSGDVHAAVYDHDLKQTYVAFGVVDANGQYGPNDEGFACFQPFLKFDEAQLWNEPKP
eukprot:TRINITY_DN6898_c0_g1_i3.p1 TRINITY_DN6898_c0_g1~~TRINITY_DN6898_c0_g1_i3.p1  ORF type:complete len:463 (+),score=116.92 TRINITY_DN6898_c0_g1_i3:913-2301(+)